MAVLRSSATPDGWCVWCHDRANLTLPARHRRFHSARGEPDAGDGGRPVVSHHDAVFRAASGSEHVTMHVRESRFRV